MALEEATLLRGQGRWSEARAAIDRASGIAAGGGTGDVHARRIAVVAEQLARDEATAAELAATRAKANSLMVALEAVGSALPFAGWDATHDVLDVSYARVFEDHGVDVEGGMPDEVRAALEALGVARPCAAFVDRWIDVRLQRAASRSRAPGESVAHLVEVALALDPDATRSELRIALIEGNAEVPLQLAASDFAERSVEDLVLLGTALHRIGERSRALDVQRAAARRFPDHFGVHFALTEALGQNYLRAPWDTVRANETFRHLTAALALQPANEYLRALQYVQMRGMAVHHFRTGDPTAGRRWFADAADAWGATLAASERAPSAEFLTWLGVARLWSDQAEDGISALVEATEVDPNHLPAHIALGEALRRRGDLERALESFERARAIRADWSEAHDGLAFCRAMATAFEGDAARAREAADDAFAADPRRTAINDVAWELVLMPPERLARHGLASSSADGEAITGAVAAVQDVARARLEEVASVQTNDASLWNTLALARLRTGDAAGAIAATQRVLELNAGANGYDRAILAMAYHELGQDAEASAAFQKLGEGNDEFAYWVLQELVELRDEAAAQLGIE